MAAALDASPAPADDRAGSTLVQNVAHPADQSASARNRRQSDRAPALWNETQERLGVVGRRQTGGEGPVITGKLAQLSQAMPGPPGQRVPGQGTGQNFGEQARPLVAADPVRQLVAEHADPIDANRGFGALRARRSRAGDPSTRSTDSAHAARRAAPAPAPRPAAPTMQPPRLQAFRSSQLEPAAPRSHRAPALPPVAMRPDPKDSARRPARASATRSEQVLLCGSLAGSLGRAVAGRHRLDTRVRFGDRHRWDRLAGAQRRHRAEQAATLERLAAESRGVRASWSRPMRSVRTQGRTTPSPRGGPPASRSGWRARRASPGARSRCARAGHLASATLIGHAQHEEQRRLPEIIPGQ